MKSLNEIDEMCGGFIINFDDLKGIFDAIGELLSDFILEKQMNIVQPGVFIFYFDGKDESGNMQIEASALGEGSVDGNESAQLLFEKGEELIRGGLRIPVCVCFTAEVWRGNHASSVCPSQQEHKKESLMVAGLTIDRTAAVRLYEINRTEKSVIQLGKHHTSELPSESDLVSLLENFYRGCIAAMDEVVSDENECGHETAVH